MTMKRYVTRVKEYVFTNPRKVKIALVAFGILLGAAILGGLFIYNNQSKIIELDYNPVVACTLLTKDEAKELLGRNVIDTNKNAVSVTQSRATSKCSYSDDNGGNMAVIGLAVRSAVTKAGIDENKRDFAASKAANQVETVEGVGDEAFYLPANGQLNILKGRAWLLITHGVGDDKSTYTLENAKKVATKVIDEK